MANDDPIAPLREVSESWKALEAQLRAVREQIEAPSRAVDTMKEQLDAPRRAIEALQRQLDTPLRAISQQAQEVHNAIAGLVMGPLIQSREAIGRIPELSEVSALEQWRTSYLGRRSELVSALTRLGSVPPEHRRVAGQPLNLARSALEQAYDLRKAELSQMALSQQLERDRIDVTLPGRPLARGCSHPSIMVIREISDLFRRIGFQVIEGPEVEWEHYNFTMLGIPPDHPARDLTDTFWITDKMLLRTHTSPNQIRAMERVGQPPIRVLVPGRCYRNEATDASHESTFFQIEGLMVDDRTTMADMKGVLSYMARGLFGQNARTRFRCDYFPFVEPGAEMSVSCGQCDGAGCRMCKYTGWLEILGCGMVHPDVLRGVNIDPERFSGWAFGLGVERIAILKYGVDDIRLFQQNDLRFLRQVG